MDALLETLGGLGSFLFGMTVMTSGLRKLAGERLRGWLARSTRNPWTGAATGALVTMLVQSSSATTVAAIGFVGAGLIPFSASLGVIFGANIGTTITGWMVAWLGFELELTHAALPLLFVAAVAYLFKGRSRVRGFGKALAGFCLLFVGIGWLQSGLAGQREAIDLGHLAASSWGGRALLVVVGVVATLITQSSSATVAMAITALNAALLDLPQAAAVIIGADIGTTGTAALATIGGTTASRRTGFAHVIYNLMTGVGAFFLLPGYLLLVGETELARSSPEVLAVAFHSTFNLLGVVLVLPFTRPFGRLVERLFPERGPVLAQAFDRGLLEDPEAAVAGLTAGSLRLSAAAVRRAAGALDPARGAGPDPTAVLAGVTAGRDFAVSIGGAGADDRELDLDRTFACVHVIDHVERLIERQGDSRHIAAVGAEPALRERALAVAALCARLADELAAESVSPASAEALGRAAREMEDDKSELRRRFIRSAGSESMTGARLDSLLDAHRWLRRTTYHVARIADWAARLGGTGEPASDSTV